jgi:hypothetical protein
MMLGSMRPRIASITLWVLFAWGGLFLGLAIWHAVRWHFAPSMADGVGFLASLVVGSLAWIGSPAVSFLARKDLSRSQILLFNVPVLLMLAVVALDALLPSGAPGRLP